MNTSSSLACRVLLIAGFAAGPACANEAAMPATPATPSAHATAATTPAAPAAAHAAPAAAPSAAAPATPAVPASSATRPAAATAAAAAEEDPMVCRTEPQLGSRVRKNKICMKKSEWQQRSRDVQEGMNSIERRASGVGPDSKLGGG
jgi:hypothetical protein